jgi:putative sigma-54 modulation protein
MRFHITFRNLDSSDGIKNYASEKIGRLQKYMNSPMDVTVTVSLERHKHCVDVSLAADGRRYAAREESDDMYASIDLVMDKLDRQVRDAKAATTNRKRHSGDQLASGKNG